MGRISPGGGGNAGNSANEESPSRRNRRPLPVNDQQHHHQDPPVVPQIFDEHCDWVTPSSRNRGPLPVNDRTTPSIDNTISRTNSSATVIPLNSRNRQIPVMPTPYQGYNHSIVQHRGPLLMNDRHCQDPPLVPQIFEQPLVHQIFDQPLVPQIFEQPLVPQIFEQPLVPQIFDEHDNLLLVSRLSHQYSISIANPNSGLPMLLNSQFRQVPSVPPFQGHNTNFVQDRVPNRRSYTMNNSSYLQIPNGRHHQFSRNFQRLDRGFQYQSSYPVNIHDSGMPPTTRNFRRSTTYQERTSATSTDNSFSSLQLPNGRQQRRVHPTNDSSSYIQLPNGRRRRRFSRNFQQLDHGSQFQSSDFVQHHGPNWSLNEGGIPLTTRNFNRRRHQRRVSGKSQWSNYELQFHNGIIPINSNVGNESLRMRGIGQEEEDPTTTSIGRYSGLGVPILIPENTVVLQLPVVIQVRDLRGEERHSSDQRTTHLHGYSRSNRREHHRNNHHHSRRTLRGTRDFRGHHSSSGEHVGHNHHLLLMLESSQVIDEHYIIQLDSQIRSSPDYGFNNIMDDDHQHEIIEEHTYDVTSGLSEESILEYLNSRTLIKETTTTSPLTDPCSSTSTTYNEICTICQEEFEKNNMIATLDCGHKYHVDCIKKWLLINNKCPVCKRTCLTLD